MPVIGGLKRRGSFRLSDRTVLVSLVGGVDLDLTEAELPPGGATVVKVSIVGGVRVLAPPDIQVQVSGFTLLGGRGFAEGTGTTGPVLRNQAIQAYGLLGGVSVQRQA